MRSPPKLAGSNQDGIIEHGNFAHRPLDAKTKLGVSVALSVEAAEGELVQLGVPLSPNVPDLIKENGLPNLICSVIVAPPS